MKNYFLIFIISTILVSCSEESTNSINEKAKEDKSLLSRISSNQIDELKEHLIQNSIFNKYDDVENLLFENVDVVMDGDIEVLIIPSKKDDKVSGVLFAFKLDENLSRQFPTNSNQFALLYHNVDNYDIDSNTGEILSYDLNYDKLFMIRDFDNGLLVNFDSFQILNNLTHGSIEFDCRGGSDGNVSWGECYRCLRGSCNTSVNCRDMTDLVDYLATRFGMSGLFFNSTTSMAAACVVISAIY